MTRSPGSVLAGLAALLLAALPVPSGLAQGAADSSLLAWVDAFGAAAEGHLAAAGPGSVGLTVAAGRGVDERKATQVVAPHFTARLRSGGRSVSRESGRLTLTLTLSIEGDRVWAVGMLEGGALVAPVAIAQAWPVDRELETVLGARSVRAGQGRWTMDRLGTLPAGVLALALTDLDADGGDDLVVLSVEGVRTLAWNELEGRPVPLGGPFPLDPRPWPRVPLGWLAVDGATVRLATTAGHRLILDPRTGRTRPGSDTVPLAQSADPSRDGWVDAEWGGRTADVSVIEPLEGMPGAVRDLARWPGRDDTWLWVDVEGLLGGFGADGAAGFAASPVGDRILLDDLDGDGAPELVTTGRSGPGEPDRVRILGVDPSLRSLPVVFDGPLGGGVTALAVGDLDFDGRRELLVVEQTDGDAVLWLVARRR